MALQFNTIGFINFNKDKNKVLKSGAITVSFNTSVKNKNGEWEKVKKSSADATKHVTMKEGYEPEEEEEKTGEDLE